MVRNIQALRCLAAMAVVIRHAVMWFHIYPPLGLGWVGRSGVDIFFVISGFIMFHTNRNGGRTAPEFWTDRVIRIAPPYWIAMLPVIALFFAGLPDGDVSQLTPQAIGLDVLFIPHVRGDGDGHPLLNVGWTLTYEMLFYALFGLTFFLRSQVKSLLALTAIFLGGWLVSMFDPRLPFALQWWTQPITLEFAGGGLLALLYRGPTRLPENLARPAAFALMALGVVGLLVGANIGGEPMGEPTALRTLLYGPPALAIVAGALMLERRGLIVQSRGVLLLGDASYSIYLVHTLVLVYAMEMYSAWLPRSLPMTALVSAIAVCLAALAGVLAHLWIEKPLTQWLKAAIGKGKQRAPAMLSPSSDNAPAYTGPAA